MAKTRIKVSSTTQADKTHKEKARIDFNKPGNLQQKVDAIAEYLGLKDHEQ